MKKFFLLAILTFIIFSLSAQQKTIDSLLKVLNTTKEDTNKVHTLYLLSIALSDLNPSKAIEYANQSLSLSKKLGFKSGISISLNALGNANTSLAEYSKAIEYYLQRYEIASEMKDSIGIATVWDNLAIVYVYLGKLDTALELRKKANKIYSSFNNPGKESSGFIWMGNIYKEQGNYSEALDYYFKGLKLSTKIKDSINIGYALINISSIFKFTKQFEKAKDYALQASSIFTALDNKEGVGASFYRISQLFYEQKIFDSAVKYLSKAKKIFEEINDYYNLITSNIELGDIYIIKERFDSALLYTKDAFISATNINSKPLIATTAGNIGIIYLKNKNYSEALKYFKASEKLLTEIDDKNNLKNLMVNFIDVYSRVNKPDSVLRYFNLFQEISDSLYSEQSTHSISEMTTKYETERKENENINLKLDNQAKESDLKNQRTLKFILFGGILFLIVIIYLIINRNRVKSKVNKLAQQNKFIQQQEYIKQQISNDLHDEIGSGLTQITMLCNQQDFNLKKHIPVDSSIFDKITEKSHQLSENLNDLIWVTNPENANLSNLILKIRTYSYEFINGSSIDLALNLPDNPSCFPTNPETNRNIYLILKEGLHNIIKHSRAKKIKIDFLVDNDKNFTLEINDDGIGFDTNMLSVKHGLKSLEKRASSIKQGKLLLKSIIGEGTTLMVNGSLA